MLSLRCLSQARVVCSHHPACWGRRQNYAAESHRSVGPGSSGRCGISHTITSTYGKARQAQVYFLCVLFVAVRLSTSNSSSASFAAALRKKGNTQKLGDESQHGGFEFGCWLTDLSPLHSFINIPLTCRIPTALLKGAQRAQCVFGRDVAVVYFFALLCIA